MGHAVRANYLYAGVADLYAETGEKQLMKNLSSIWDDITYRKIYITGGCGALYDGVSPGWNHFTISLAFSRFTRHTAEHISCQTRLRIMKPVRRLVISSLSWRMLETTADARYMDMVENEL
ncbi:beta-L-arabinofuranosidase domain-containing protein [Segatella copri]|uniref:Glycoside hydrolase family 127 protein n=1 Tax=Segatella copri TaxID=165179 RepID=A0AAW5U6D9_9BACT|nr:beta-L-arabinofuranosidase domain-containing protein [Segatella copri]MCW4094569.1 glycoside hydrolase family 127 protein [Segatella copri]